jgi:NAD(P)-dependent dehydrogenase (short-subunit alcohol dehydrogenase family)
VALLDGRVAIVTGAGRGLGREHALALARAGAKVVVNDLPATNGERRSSAEDVAAEIQAFGGSAIASHVKVGRWHDARQLVEDALTGFGGLDVLVNNAGILRDRTLVKLEEDDLDAMLAVHVKGHVAMTKWASIHWRSRAKAGRPAQAAIINTTSGSGLFGNPGQANYGAAKAAIANLTVVAALELKRYGVRCNAIAPAARTRLTETSPAVADLMATPAEAGFDEWHPANVSPLVVYLASDQCAATGKLFYVCGGTVGVYRPVELVESITKHARWTPEELAETIPDLVDAVPSRVDLRARLGAS